MSRNHRRPGVVRIICTDSYHRDTPEFARRGHHYLKTLRLGHRQWRPDEGLTWKGQRPRAPSLPVRDPEGNPALQYMGTVPGAPVKEFPRDGQLWIYRLECSCGRKPQRNEAYLMDLISRRLGADPGATRIDIDITTI